MMTTSKRVYVVQFEPSLNADGTTLYGVGGHDWFHDRGEAVVCMVNHLKYPGHDVRYVEREFPAHLTNSEINDALMKEF